MKQIIKKIVQKFTKKNCKTIIKTNYIFCTEYKCFRP